MLLNKLNVLFEMPVYDTMADTSVSLPAGNEIWLDETRLLSADWLKHLRQGKANCYSLCPLLSSCGSYFCHWEGGMQQKQGRLSDLRPRWGPIQYPSHQSQTEPNTDHPNSWFKKKSYGNHIQISDVLTCPQKITFTSSKDFYMVLLFWIKAESHLAFYARC